MPVDLTRIEVLPENLSNQYASVASNALLKLSGKTESLDKNTALATEKAADLGRQQTTGKEVPFTNNIAHEIKQIAKSQCVDKAKMITPSLIQLSKESVQEQARQEAANLPNNTRETDSPSR